MKKFIFVMLVMLTGFAVQAQEKKEKNKNAKYDVSVNGNCEMCKKRIEKAAYAVKGVKSAQWHQDHQDLHLIIDETKCSVDDIHKALAAAGHDTEKVKAKDEDYEKLHACCQYERLK